MAKKEKMNTQQFEEILGESLKFHGLLTPVSKEIEDIKLPQHLADANFLSSATKKKPIELPKLRLAAFKSNAKKKK